MIYVYVYVYIYIYIYLSLSLSIYIYIYIYISKPLPERGECQGRWFRLRRARPQRQRVGVAQNFEAR